MKLLHTSDWHLGRYFHQQSLLEDQAYILAQLVGYAREEQPDAVLVAGDIYDRSLPPADAIELLEQTLEQLVIELQLPVIMISGNHDGPERLGFGSRYMRQAGLTIVTDFAQMLEPVMLTDADGEVAIWSMPYHDPYRVADYLRTPVQDYQHAHELLVAEIQQEISRRGLQQARHVLQSHCFLAGGSETDSERPLNVGGADQVRPDTFAAFDYVALGHLHRPQTRGQEHIRYSGSILKYSFSEVDHQKGLLSVELDGEGFQQARLLPLTPRREVRCLSGTLAELLDRAACDPQPDDYVSVELTDTQAVLEPLAQLREFYPNVLDLRKPARGAGAQGQAGRLSQTQLQRSELDVLEDFYQEVTGSTLSQPQQRLAREVLNEVTREGNK